MFDTSIEIYNETTYKLPSDLAVLALKNKILGKKYALYLNILNSKNSQKLNKKIRKQTYTPNTLSFLYSKTSGEIVITPEVVEKEMREYGHNFEQHFFYLLIHSLLHLKGLDHGNKMEGLEEKYLAEITQKK